MSTADSAARIEAGLVLALDVLARIESRLGRIDTAINQLTEEVQQLSDTQTQINTDVAALTQALADFAAEWQQISQRLAMEAPQIDTSKLDALAVQAQQMDAAWKAQVAPAATPAPAAAETTTSAAASSDSNPPAATTAPGSATPEPATATADPAATTPAAADPTTTPGATPA